MQREVVLVTGITGFLGSHIAENLSSKYDVIGLVRTQSDLWRLREAGLSLKLINHDEAEFREKIIAAKPSVVIHSAWAGVAANNRDDWKAQSQNLPFTTELLELAKEAGVTKFIGLGSQAEYGYFSGKINEDAIASPLSAYGACKLAAMEIVKSFCHVNHIDWYWLRLFPMYGIREDLNWFMPMVIDHALHNKPLDLTRCEQKYAYLHVDDFSNAIAAILQQSGNSGIYNLASDQPRILRSVLEMIREKTSSEAAFQFGALPYRSNQVMHMEGDSAKFFNTFDFQPKKEFTNGIEELISYYKNKLTNR